MSKPHTIHDCHPGKTGRVELVDGHLLRLTPDVDEDKYIQFDEDGITALVVALITAAIAPPPYPIEDYEDSSKLLVVRSVPRAYRFDPNHNMGEPASNVVNLSIRREGQPLAVTPSISITTEEVDKLVTAIRELCPQTPDQPC